MQSKMTLKFKVFSFKFKINEYSPQMDKVYHLQLLFTYRIISTSICVKNLACRYFKREFLGI